MRRLQATVSPIVRVNRFAIFFLPGSRRLTNAVPLSRRYIIRSYRSQRDWLILSMPYSLDVPPGPGRDLREYLIEPCLV